MSKKTIAGEGEAKRLSLYVSGPMSGIPHFNYPLFTDATAALRAHGFDVVSPHELDIEAGVDLTEEFTADDRRAALRRDVTAVTEADGIAVLTGWHHSTGARAEVALANAIPIPIFTVDEWLADAHKELLP
ncbi:nucleoside deoxyribosyltransferase [Microbacterium phage Barnstormer]|uniref:Nucleoside deoxyribosyltransferase n=1 Tax=Microbacterium phage Barnstormer TaxID=3028491 RepID=A0AAF0CDN1_9CAUD|nr:nucleoside deoxyribosyltransferase [Microbacterium phage Barnstormer]WDS52133.1 nucleoside deoxyribosyltransferase [Microbacterium phage UtzChips]